MADVTLQPRSPLANCAIPGRHGKSAGAPGVIIRERTGLALASVMARKDRTTDTAAALTKRTGQSITNAPKRVTGNGLAITGVAPGQWLALAEPASAPGIIGELQRTLADIAAVTEQSDSRVVLEISGPNARDTLAKGIQIDLDPRAFHIGDAAQTMASHLNLHLALIDPTPTFELIGMATFAGSLWSWLSSSAAEFGYEFHRS